MIHLTRTDPARNMARFYTMALQPTLFGTRRSSFSLREKEAASASRVAWTFS